MRKMMILLLLAVVAVPAFAGPVRGVITVLPALRQQVNAESENNTIPWAQKQAQYEVKLRARVAEGEPLVSSVQGEFSYTIYRLSCTVVKVIEGKFKEKEITFFVERPFPTPESHLRYKELWPFAKDRVLTFKLRAGAGRMQIVAVEP